MAKKTCIHFDPVKPGCEIHNWRLKELDYVIKDLTPNNEHWVDPRYEGKSLADIRKEIAERYQAHVGQKMQAKAAPIREAAVVIKPDTTMADLQLLAKQLEKEFGIKCIQIHIHRDEGFNKTNPDPSKLWQIGHTMTALHYVWDVRIPQECRPSRLNVSRWNVAAVLT